MILALCRPVEEETLGRSSDRQVPSHLETMIFPSHVLLTFPVSSMSSFVTWISAGKVWQLKWRSESSVWDDDPITNVSSDGVSSSVEPPLLLPEAPDVKDIPSTKASSLSMRELSESRRLPSITEDGKVNPKKRTIRNLKRKNVIIGQEVTIN